MGANNPERQHYIPRMLLKRFCDDNRRLWVNDGDKIYHSKPKNVFVERDLYTTLDIGHASSAKNYECERALGDIESRAAPAVHQIIKQAHRGKCPQLSRSLRDAWKQFLLASARRTPESQKRVSAGSDFDDVFYEAAMAVATRDSYPLPAKEILYSDLRVLRMAQIAESNSNAKFAAGYDPHLQRQTAKFCGETGLGVAVIRIPGESFVIGSHGLAIVKSGVAQDRTDVGWLPISYDVAVCATAFPDREWLRFLDRDNGGAEFIVATNEASAKNSSMIAGRSQELVRSLNPRQVAN